MPVFVEWQWKERTKSFLVIFHFYDDFSRPNLRIKKYEKGHLWKLTPNKAIDPMKAWMTWAPSHPDLALLTELLSYANIINGLKESEKRDLRTKLGVARLEHVDGELGVVIYSPYGQEEMEIEDKITVIYSQKPNNDSKKSTYPTEVPLHVCAELCPEYIDYLKKVLKPYLKEA